MVEITSDEELKDRVRADTQYDDNPDELPESTLDVIIETAKLRVKLKAGTDEWYEDDGLGLVLHAYTCMRAKVAVENVNIEEYQLGNQRVRTRNADPETSQQMQQWADDIVVGLQGSDRYNPQRPALQNSSSYIGGQYIKRGGRRTR